MVSPFNVPRVRVRHSFAGPVVLIAIGVCFLSARWVYSIGRRSEHWFAHYWPVLLIVWGVLKLVEYQQAQREGVRYSGIGAGGSFLADYADWFWYRFHASLPPRLGINWGSLRYRQ